MRLKIEALATLINALLPVQKISGVLLQPTEIPVALLLHLGVSIGAPFYPRDRVDRLATLLFFIVKYFDPHHVHWFGYFLNYGHGGVSQGLHFFQFGLPRKQPSANCVVLAQRQYSYTQNTTLFDCSFCSFMGHC